MKEYSLITEIYKKNGRQINFNKDKKVYNLGCGKQKFQNVIGVDAISDKSIDICHDLNKIPWPIPENSADTVLAFHFLEHIENLVNVMKEIHRISKNKARIVIEVPYFRSPGAFQDPTHKNFFTTRTMDYFCKEKQDPFNYIGTEFKLINLSIGWPAENSNPIKKLFKKILKKNRDFYDTFLSQWVSSKILVFELEVEK